MAMTATITLTPKETSLLNDLKSQEQLCIEKSYKYASEACDGQLKNLFNQIAQDEQRHLQTLEQIASGKVPQMNSGGGMQQSIQPTASCCSPTDKQKDAYLCSDFLATEKFVSADYNTCIFEFADANVRDILNHIQKEEQQHGKMIYDYMSVNGMYN